MAERKIRTPEDTLRKVEEGLRATYFRWAAPELLESEQGRVYIKQHVWERYEQARYDFGPWVDAASPLAGKHIVEIGSGTGSSAAGFAAHAGRVTGYEIDQVSVEAAQRRFSAMEIENARVDLVPAQRVIEVATGSHAGDVDVFLLYAVLEHMTVAERIDALRRAWAALPSGGMLVVIETPNRLTYTDLHTSRLPFFHMLPVELAAHYYRRSPRRDFIDKIDGTPVDERPMALVRWGNGVSYHEFDVGIDADIDACVVADGFEDAITRSYPIRLDDNLLLRYFEEAKVGRHRAFTRNHLNFVLQKP